ncbi:sodium-dependent phosphate transport protein 4 isoform X3 [Meriones unguiculatus]|uniref:sodium-dependent phosphate transport protein 4 isoform X3 n=1 Tax=Meriones unguiculatus TaxID=10047 RepID=UPI000B4F5D11|nr:sodium-dependent phosphate transport protein 4 isoform X3 [Meriones unguiculatus]
MATMVELSPTGEQSDYVLGKPTDKKTPPQKVPGLCSVRYGIAFITHFCNFTLLAQNAIISITMVAMVNSTDHAPHLNGSSEELPAGLNGDKHEEASKHLSVKGTGYGGQMALWQRWAPPNERGRLCSIALSGMILGIFTVLLVGGVISNSLGWPFVFYIFGGIGVVCWILWLILVYDDPVSHPWIGDPEKEYILSSLDHQFSSEEQPLPVKGMLRSLPLWSMSLCALTHQWLVNTFVIYTPTYISSVFQVNIRDNGFLSSLPFLVAWTIGMLGGQLADFLLSKNFSVVTVRKIVTTLGTIPPATLIVALPYVRSSFITTVTFLTLSCGICPMSQPGVYINALDIAPRYASFLMGTSRGFAHSSAVLVPIVGGFFLNQDSEFGWRNFFFLSFAISLFGLILFLVFGKADVQEWARERKVTRL